MRKIIFITTIIICSFSCRNSSTPYKGEFSYKTSGSVVVKSEQNQTQKEIETRIGQLNIIAQESNNEDNILLIFNELKGGLRKINATIVDDTIQIIPYKMRLKLPNSLIEYEVNVTGKGIRYDKTLMLTETYIGTSTDANDNSTIFGQEILTIATRN